MKLNLVNKQDAYIANNTLLTLFNIFDSRIYLDIVYNITPESVREGQTEDQFVKNIRGRINKNSRTKNAYADNTNKAPETEDVKEVQEFVANELTKYEDATISDMMYCEQYGALVQAQIDNVDNAMYNAGISPFLVEEYIGESFYDINNFMDGIYQEADIRAKRETMQQGICSLMDNMEEIVKMDKTHRWNANTLGSRYKTSAGLLNPIAFLLPIIVPQSNLSGSSEQHTNIKQVYHSTKKALKGKRGNFTSEQLQTLSKLNELVDKLWGCVKMFWLNPRNWQKEYNLFKNTKVQKRTKMIAEIAREIVALKPQLKFVMEDDFVNEAWYDGSSDYIFQEATTEDNRKRLAKAIELVLRDMKVVKDLVDKNQWTNAAAKSKFKTMLSAFAGRTEEYCNVKEAIKYLDRAANAKAAGALTDSEQRVLLDLLTRLKDIQKCARRMGITGMEIGANIKESPNTHKIGQLAGEIVAMENDLKFVKDAPKKEVPKEETSTEEEKTTTESFEYDFDKFCVIMEQETGEIPGYMQTRLKMTDRIGATVTPTKSPDIPQNPIPELTDSIDAKVGAGGDSLGDMLGSGFENNPNKEAAEGKIVVNVTNNYNNSFNRDSNNTTTTTSNMDDHSQGKVTNTTTTNTNSLNNSSHDNKTDSSKNKSIKKNSSTRSSGSNNNNNSNDAIDTKDSITSKDNSQKLSSGMSIQEMFMILESKEPQSSGGRATPPKEDLLTSSMHKAMDRDKDLLKSQQGAKKTVTNIANTGKAVLKPVSRTKQWLTKVVDSLIKRDEDKVKAELIENDSYRSIVFKASRIALKLGITSVCFTIQPYLGATYLAIQGLKAADKHRLKKEVGREMETELKIIDEKIKDLESIDTVEARKQKYEYMRLKKKTEDYFIKTLGSGYLKHPKDV